MRFNVRATYAWIYRALRERLPWRTRWTGLKGVRGGTTTTGLFPGTCVSHGRVPAASSSSSSNSMANSSNCCSQGTVPGHDSVRRISVSVWVRTYLAVTGWYPDVPGFKYALDSVRTSLLLERGASGASPAAFTPRSSYRYQEPLSRT